MKTYSSSICCSIWVWTGIVKSWREPKDFKCKNHIIKRRCLDLMRYSLLYSPGIGCFLAQGASRCVIKSWVGELLLCPSMDNFSYEKAHTPFSHPHHCIVLGVFWVREHCILCTWRSNGPLAEVCVCLFLVNSAILLAWVYLVSLCVLVLLIPKELIKQGATVGASWNSAAWRETSCPAQLWGEAD